MTGLAAPPTTRRSAGRRALIPAVAIAVVIADQASKTWALHHAGGPGRHVFGPLWFVRTYNSGAAFGLGRGVTPVVETVVVLLVAGLLLFGRRASRSARWPAAVSLGLLVGGAVSNLGDRLFRHIPGHPSSVVDFIDAAQIGGRSWWPVFNLADACIVVASVALAISYHRSARPAPDTDP